MNRQCASSTGVTDSRLPARRSNMPADSSRACARMLIESDHALEAAMQPHSHRESAWRLHAAVRIVVRAALVHPLAD